jgi:hypothetical protein
MLLHLRLRSWLCGSTKEPSGFLVNHWKRRELGVPSTNHHSWLGSHEVPTRPLFWGSTKKPSTTSSWCFCHHAARTWPCRPPGPSNQAYLSSPHLEALPATTFRACSSPAPTPIKPQPTPAILSQESVHTTLSITHHTRNCHNYFVWFLQVHQIKISQNQMADFLAKQGLASFDSNQITFSGLCTNPSHVHGCPLLSALQFVTINFVIVLTTLCY